MARNQIDMNKVSLPEVPRLNARLALIDAGLWAQVKAYFSDPARSEQEVAYFEDAQSWSTRDPILKNAATALGIDQSTMVSLFEAAAERTEG